MEKIYRFVIHCLQAGAGTSLQARSSWTGRHYWFASGESALGPRCRSRRPRAALRLPGRDAGMLHSKLPCAMQP